MTILTHNHGISVVLVLAITIIISLVSVWIPPVQGDRHSLPTTAFNNLAESTQGNNLPCDRSRKVFLEPAGDFSHGPVGVNYTQDSHCEWLIKAKNSSQFISLVIHSLGTECSYDYIYVYDGDSFNSTLLGSFSGKTEPQKLTAKSGSMLVLLYSDTNYVLDGFHASYFITNCLNNCNNHGKCVGHQCVCRGEYVGPDCAEVACPDGCGERLNQGKCDNGLCKCNENYSGRLCDLHINPAGGNWRWLSKEVDGMTARAAHTAIYAESTDSLYVFGGYDLNNVLDSLQIYKFRNSVWEDEWSVPLQNTERYRLQKFDKKIFKAILKNNDTEESRRWGLKSNIFRDILLSVADSNFTLKKPKISMNSSDLENILERVTDNRPNGRYGHAAANVPGGFVIFGGKLANGNLSDELWFYNVTEKSGEWSLRAPNSNFVPPPLTRHTITYGHGYLYVFGGSLANGEFSSRIFKVKLSLDPEEEQWEEIFPHGGKSLDVRLAAHTTVYYQYTNSLIVYGGIMTSVARFSKLSDRFFAFQLDQMHWTEILYPRPALADYHIPRERAFHSAIVAGNYLIVFGGYTHRHNKEEKCYDNQLYLYHLGCHSWIKHDVLGAGLNNNYPKQQGVFAHASAVRMNNTLLIVGGYHGNVNADLLAYELPQMFVVRDPSNHNPEAACKIHETIPACLADLECGWCSADNICYGRTIGANCTTNLQTTRCPGICPSLRDCHSCLVHGTSWNSYHEGHSISSKLGLNHCTWCVQNAQCHHKDDNYGVCGEDTPSQIPGWWGSKGTEVTKPEHCTNLDRRPGLTYMKYHHPVNWSMPDYVTIVNATTVDFISPMPTTHTEHSFTGEIVARLLGYVRPPKNWTAVGKTLRLCSSFSQAILRTGTDFHAPEKTDLKVNITTQQSTCSPLPWPNSTKFTLDFQGKRKVGIGTYNNQYQHSKMEFQLQKNNVWKVFTFEYLEPYSYGRCEQYKNCLQCLTDAQCGWCDITNECLSRSVNELAECRNDNGWKYLTIEATKCSNCSNYITCDKCIETSICEWWAEDARCARLGRSATAIRRLDQCPTPCLERKTCSDCLSERGRCVWCEATEQCFSFAVYTSEYQFGICREWFDQAVPMIATQTEIDYVGGGYHVIVPKIQQCKSCSQHTNCSSCLETLSCGWCFDPDNPIIGKCLQGDFSRPSQICAVVLNSTTEDAEWAYAQCPDVDECGLGLHDCHLNAKCTNTHGSYKCQCRKGFVGDGHSSCVKTCYDPCVHGQCSGAPNYICNCDLGWTEKDCSVNCGCHNHSTCKGGVGQCDECQNWTEGESCERCRVGSYGNATSDEGCKPCECNGHGDESLGICDSVTGECFCRHNTKGFKCDNCQPPYYGDPHEGGQCYYQCESRGMLTYSGIQGIGSHQSYRNPWGGSEVRECLWLISPHSLETQKPLKDALIQITIDRQNLNIACDDNVIYVYDSLPDLTDYTQQSQLLAIVCSPESIPQTIESRSGHLTVHYKQGKDEQGFNAIYTVNSCSTGTCFSPHICDNKTQCVCPSGFVGTLCEIEICPNACNERRHQGFCDRNYGRCVCSRGYSGSDCSVKMKSHHLIVTDLFNTVLLSDSFEHLKKTIPRFGHSLNADRRGSLWMFGGYSLSNGPLNDIRQFDTKNGTWMQVTVDSTPEAKMPQGRYFHGAEMVASKQTVYIYGGLTNTGKLQPNTILGDFWQFSIQNQRWQEIKMHGMEKPPPLAGHTLTFVKVSDKESLLIIGGVSVEEYHELQLWEYDLTTERWEIVSAPAGLQMINIYGHSAVFHAPTQSVYVFGGYSSTTRNALYALNLEKMSWTELPVFNELNRREELLPRGRFFHAAITTDNYMLVFGGRTAPYNASDALLAYVYKCNQWIRLTEDVETIGKLPTSTYAESMTIDHETKSIYVVGGWDGSSEGRVIKINLPEDLCELWSTGKYLCRHYMGCSFCITKEPTQESASHCYSDGRTDVCSPHNITLSLNNGTRCDDAWIARRNCSTFSTCSACLASWPTHSGVAAVCQWCDGVLRDDHCLPVGAECEEKQTSIISPTQCSAASCEQLNCDSCLKSEECLFVQKTMNESAVCEDRDVAERHKYEKVTSCHDECHTFTTCTSCLDTSIYADEDSDEIMIEDRSSRHKNCKWSTALNSCLSPNLQPLHCAGGVCGLVLDSNEMDSCPEPCQAYTQCSMCLRHAHCGWCSRQNHNGEGVCTEGSIESVTEYPASSTCDLIYASRNNLTSIDPNDVFTWNYVNCPSENECLNGHHSCDPKSEKCVDKDNGYECECGDGYAPQEGDGECVPVCKQGCVRGNCVEPNVCKCDFGYVGANCSIQCQCNGHSNCGGPDKLDQCLECHNNTMGAKCERCKPLFVGKPRMNGICVPCSQYCHGHSDACVASDAEEEVKNMTRSQLEKFLTEGTYDNAVCLRCANKTEGAQCEKCIPGHFRGSENYQWPCRPCECHGHGDTCDAVTGEGCNCSNNTEPDLTCSATSSKNSAQLCWKVQCSKCKDSYAGNPIDGHQCYKQITVESRMCFDAKPIEECKMKPSSLRPGQTVFFVIQPRFMNVDIRIIVDVTQGEIDFFMSPQDDSFIVLTNQSTGHHMIYLDNRYHWLTDVDSGLSEPLNIAQSKYDHENASIGLNEEKVFWTPHIHDCVSSSGTGFSVKDVRANELSTFITLHQCNTLLRVFGLRNRLVLTLPQNAHNLSATRFFIALRASQNSDHSYGSIVFRQDQLHIDLFVFFSVFFSCFFLFLAVCVVAWKVKQASDLRRVRRRQHTEMEHMAKRPFARIWLSLSGENDTPVQMRRRGRSRPSSAPTNAVRPVAIEPTSDYNASVGTVFIRLPGKHKAPVAIALGSSFIICPRYLRNHR